MESIVEAAKEAVAPRNGQVYFKTTPAKQYDWDLVDDTEVSLSLEGMGVRVFDAMDFTMDIREKADEIGGCLYWDPMHYCNQVGSHPGAVMAHGSTSSSLFVL